MVLLAGLVLVLGPGGDFACLASHDAGTAAVPSPSAVEGDYVWARDAPWWEEGMEAHSQFGYSVASAGNVDDNHGDDVLVGAVKDGTIDGTGAAYLFLSTGGGLEKTHAWAAGGGGHAVNFGSAVAGVGDVNDDGRDDAIIADDGYKAYLEIKENQWQWVQAGGAFVYEGIAGVGLSLEPTWSYTGTVKEGKFGSAVAGAGDLNGDGVDDIVVGARLYTDQTDNTENSEGAVYVFFGSSDGPSEEPDWLIDGDQPGALLGYAVSAAGDVDGDGCDDLIAGAPFYRNPETGLQEGAVFLFLGRGTETCPGLPPSSVADAAWIRYGGQEESWFGYAVAGVGDVNGDGHPDVVVSTPWYHRPSDDVEVGAAFGFCGDGSSLGSEPCWTVYGNQPGGRFGSSMAGAGDVDADGFDDVIVGAVGHAPSPDVGYAGAALLYFGSEGGLAPWAAWRAGGDKNRTEFGASVGSIGRVLDTESADGVIVGAPLYFTLSEPYGAAFAFYGPLEPSHLQPAAYLPLVLSSAN